MENPSSVARHGWRGSWSGFGLAAVASVGVSVWVWTLLFPWLGYGTATRVVAHLSFFAAALLLAWALRIAPRGFGLGPRHLGWAVAVGAVAYAAVMAGAAVGNAAFGLDVAVLRTRYDPVAFVDNWLLTALGEELLFAGVVFVAAVRALPRHRRGWAVPLVAWTFAAMHLPGYLAIGYPVGSIVGRLALNAVSWSVFGTIYLLSGNLWLVVVAHAATDYGVTPLITNEPAFGLAFMATLVVGAWWQGRRGRGAPNHHHGDGAPARGG